MSTIFTTVNNRELGGRFHSFITATHIDSYTYYFFPISFVLSSWVLAKIKVKIQNFSVSFSTFMTIYVQELLRIFWY